MKAVITVIGKDTIGIIAKTTTVLAENRVNILDISQTIMEDIFTMVMLVDISTSRVPFKTLAESLEGAGKEMGIQVKIQHADIFDSMHRV